MTEKKECKFLITVTGKDIHFEVPINKSDDLIDIENILKILKKKL